MKIKVQPKLFNYKYIHPTIPANVAATSTNIRWLLLKSLMQSKKKHFQIDFDLYLTNV